MIAFDKDALLNLIRGVLMSQMLVLLCYCSGDD